MNTVSNERQQTFGNRIAFNRRLQHLQSEKSKTEANRRPKTHSNGTPLQGSRTDEKLNTEQNAPIQEYLGHNSIKETREEHLRQRKSKVLEAQYQQTMQRLIDSSFKEEK